MKLRRLLLPCFAAFLACFSVSVSFAAETVPDLYQATVPVVPNTANPEMAAAQTALQDVLIKVSGNSAINQVPALSSALQDPTQFTQQILLNPAIQGDPNQEYTVRFDPNSINTVLTQAKQPIWSNTRPLVLAWIGIEQGQETNLLSSSSSGLLPGTVDQAAQARGLPLILPILDLQDMSVISTDVVMDNLLSVIQAASVRYGSDAILVGRITQPLPGSWQGQWTLLFNHQEKNWQTSNTDLNALLTGGINDTANTLGVTLAVASTAPSATQNPNNVLLIKVTAVNGLTDYANVMHYLKTLGPVTDVQLIQVNGTELDLQLSVTGGIDALNQALAVDGKLKPITAGTNATVVSSPPATTELPTPQFAASRTAATNITMEYQWQG